MIRDAYILWPTIRPNWCANALKRAPGSWLNLANRPQNVHAKIAVNFEGHKAELLNFLAGIPNVEVVVVGDARPGVCHASSVLSKSLQAKPEDIVILASDDFRPIPYWDAWMSQHFDDFDGCLLVNDGYQTGACVTLPIMTYACLLKLNRIIYHPIYHHMYSDAELFDVLVELKLLKNLRIANQPTFEHVHWVIQKRVEDQWDSRLRALWVQDMQTYGQRKPLLVSEKLK